MKKIIFCIYSLLATINAYSQVTDDFEISIYLESEWDYYFGIPLKEPNYRIVQIQHSVKDTLFKIQKDSQELIVNKKDSIVFFKYSSPRKSLEGQLFIPKSRCIWYSVLFDPRSFDPRVYFFEAYLPIRFGKWKFYQDVVYEEINYNTKVIYEPYPYYKKI